MSQQPLKLLTIGGSDSGGSAGIQADLKTWTALGVHGMSALTVITAQNTTAISGVHFIPPDFLAQQIDMVLGDYGADAIKTGFIGRTELIEVIAGRLKNRPNIVIDPVLINSQGKPIFDDSVVAAYRDLLLPVATITTPNLGEAELLSDMPITTLAAAETAAHKLAAMGNCAVLIKRFRPADEMIDVFFDGTSISHFPTPYIETNNTHGSGDSLSSTIAVGLAKGLTWPEIITTAQSFVARGLAESSCWKLGAGKGPISHFHLF